jgi:hypothetical protein
MDNRKWLKRKYPESFDQVNSFLNDYYLSIFKSQKFKLGELKNDIQLYDYKKGDICMFKKSNPVNDYNHPYSYVIVKCGSFTASGYHSFNIGRNDCKEITK